MPSKGRIQSTGFQDLLLELGVNPNGVPFDLRSEVTPVVLVGGTVSFVAAPTPAYQITNVFTTGVQIAPAAGFVLADTGPLPPGTYSLQVFMTITESNDLQFQWRDAANGANLFEQEIRLNDRFIEFVIRMEITTADERFRVLNRVAGAVGSRYSATVFART